MLYPPFSHCLHNHFSREGSPLHQGQLAFWTSMLSSFHYLLALWGSADNQRACFKQPLLIVIIFIGRSKPITSANCQHTSLPMDWPLPALLGRTKTVATPLPSWFVLVHTEFWDLNLSVKVEEIKPKTWVFQLFSCFFTTPCSLSSADCLFPNFLFQQTYLWNLVTRCVHRQW